MTIFGVPYINGPSTTLLFYVEKRLGSKRPITLWLNFKLQTIKNHKFRIVFLCADISILAWRLPRTEEPGRLQPVGSKGRAQLRLSAAQQPVVGGAGASSSLLLPRSRPVRSILIILWKGAQSQREEKTQNCLILRLKKVRQGKVSTYLKFSE